MMYLVEYNHTFISHFFFAFTEKQARRKAIRCLKKEFPTLPLLVTFQEKDIMVENVEFFIEHITKYSLIKYLQMWLEDRG